MHEVRGSLSTHTGWDYDVSPLCVSTELYSFYSALVVVTSLPHEIPTCMWNLAFHKNSGLSFYRIVCLSADFSSCWYRAPQLLVMSA